MMVHEPVSTEVNTVGLQFQCEIDVVVHDEERAVLARHSLHHACLPASLRRRRELVAVLDHCNVRRKGRPQSQQHRVNSGGVAVRRQQIDAAHAPGEGCALS